MAPERGNISLHIQRNIFLGLFILIPLWLTLYIAYIVFILLATFTYPIIAELPFSTNKFVMYSLSFIFSLVLIYFIGILTKMWLGKILLSFINNTMRNIPVIGSFYKSLKQLADTFNNNEKGNQKVVLIDFPQEGIKTIGFLIKTIEDSKTKQILVTVFVPTTPNPTSGFLQIVPIEKTIALDWSFEEAMSFIISGGSNMPEKQLSFK